MKEFFRFHFQKAHEEQRSLIHSWLERPHVTKWFYGEGLQSTIDHLDAFFDRPSPFFQYWIGYEGEIPFAFLITSEVNKPEDSLTRFCEKEGKAITLDMLIGEEKYLGKGLSHRLIEEFLLTQFGGVSEVLIDPEKTNTHAVHIYEKVGFKVLEEFIPTWSKEPHYMMRLGMDHLLKCFCSLERYAYIPKEYESILFKGISEEASQKKNMSPITSFSLFLKDQKEVVGGISAASVYGSLHIDSLWVSLRARKKGVATYLMKEVEKWGKENKTFFATVHTMDFEALPFYQKLGYSIEFIREGYSGDSKMFLLRKAF